MGYMHKIRQIKSILFRLRVKRLMALVLLIALAIYAYIDMSKFWALLGLVVAVGAIIRWIRNDPETPRDKLSSLLILYDDD